MNAQWIVYGLRLKNTSRLRYIGITAREASVRLTEHLKPSNKKYPVHHWIEKHGRDQIEMHVLEVCPKGDVEYLHYAEKFWIDFYTNHLGRPLLNLTTGGEGVVGYVRPEELNRAHSERMSGSGNPMYGSSRMGPLAPRYGMKNSQKAREKIREYHLSEKNSWRGSNHTEETKAKMSKLRAEYWTEERRKELSEKTKGRVRSDTHRENLSKAKKGKPVRGMHTRWHTNRGIVKPDCIFCQEA